MITGRTLPLSAPSVAPMAPRQPWLCPGSLEACGLWESLGTATPLSLCGTVHSGPGGLGVPLPHLAFQKPGAMLTSEPQCRP